MNTPNTPKEEIALLVAIALGFHWNRVRVTYIGQEGFDCEVDYAGDGNYQSLDTCTWAEWAANQEGEGDYTGGEEADYEDENGDDLDDYDFDEDYKASVRALMDSGLSMDEAMEEVDSR